MQFSWLPVVCSSWPPAPGMTQFALIFLACNLIIMIKRLTDSRSYSKFTCAPSVMTYTVIVFERDLNNRKSDIQSNYFTFNTVPLCLHLAILKMHYHSMSSCLSLLSHKQPLLHTERNGRLPAHTVCQLAVSFLTLIIIYDPKMQINNLLIQKWNCYAGFL